MATMIPPKMTAAEADAFLAQFTDADLDAMTVAPEDDWLTDAAVDRIVAEVRASRPAGRPSLTAPGEHSPKLVVRVPRRTDAILTDFAAASGVRKSSVVRDALDIYFDLAPHAKGAGKAPAEFARELVAARAG